MLNATLVRKINVTDELVIFHIRPDEGVSDFHPGQYVALGLLGEAERPAHFPPETEIPPHGKLIKRAYSIGSPPEEKGYLEFYIAILPTGIFTSRLAALKEGDRLYAAPKITGTFTLDAVPSHKNLVLVSTGTGIAPYLSMIRTQSTWTEGRKITLVQGVRYKKDFAYREELLGLAKERDNFKYVATVSRETVEKDDHLDGVYEGRLQKLFANDIVPLNPETDHVFLCGNPTMIDEVEKILIGEGFTEHTKKHPGNLHFEKYW